MNKPHDYCTRPDCPDCHPQLDTGTKFDKDKPMWDLLPWNELEEVVKVITFGAKKYSANNWQKVEPKERYLAAAFRHLSARAKGRMKDEETGLPHLAHACCCLLFLMWHDHNSK